MKFQSSLSIRHNFNYQTIVTTVNNYQSNKKPSENISVHINFEQEEKNKKKKEKLPEEIRESITQFVQPIDADMYSLISLSFSGSITILLKVDSL